MRAPVQRWTSGLGACVAILLGLGACGVESRGSGVERTQSGGLAGYREAFPPVRLLVHPLTRMRNDRTNGDLRIDAHVELLDEFDHLTKGLGEFRFEVDSLNRDAVRLPDGSRLIWRIPMETPSTASEAFDPLTRSYRFVLTELSPGFKADSIVLRATFVSSSGTRLYGERAVVIDPREQ